MTAGKSFPWKLGCCILILGIIGVLAYDIQTHGSFKDSNIGFFINDIEASSFSEYINKKYQHVYVSTLELIQVDLPVYLQRVYKVLAPFLWPIFKMLYYFGNTLINIFDIIKGYIYEKVPIIVAWFEYNTPGLVDFIKEEYAAFAKICFKIYDYMLYWSMATIMELKKWIDNSNLTAIDWQKYSEGALNTTQHYASWTFDWICEKVQMFTKVKNV